MVDDDDASFLSWEFEILGSVQRGKAVGGEIEEFDSEI